MKLLPVVEGDGDVTAVPALIRHVLADHKRFDVQILQPHKRGEWPKVKKDFERFFNVATLEAVPILWVLDFDCEECISVEVELQFARERATAIRRDAAFELCFIVREFESLFLCDELTTRQVFSDIPANVTFPTAPEAIRDAKGWLSAARPPGSAYKPTMHQAKLASQLDLAKLRESSASFRRFEDCLLRLIAVESSAA